MGPVRALSNTSRSVREGQYCMVRGGNERGILNNNRGLEWIDKNYLIW
jgi:hypothetical protein